VAFCGKCGSQNGDSATFCKDCGAQLTGAPAAAPPPPPPVGSIPPTPAAAPPPPFGAVPPPPHGATPPPYAPPAYAPPPVGYDPNPAGYGPAPAVPQNPNLPGPYAEWGTRALGFLIDAGLILAAFVPFYVLALITNSIVFLLISYLAELAVTLFIAAQVGEAGQSPGMRIVGVKCVHAETGQTLGSGMGIVRALATIINSVICYVGWLFPLWDRDKQTLADKIVSTVVCVVPKQPFSITPPSTLG
jgi:uncharacterized RDD family membrane protein YckC